MEAERGTEKPLHALRIEDYALIGDGETAALVSREGSVDWLCWPSFSSSACFAALLGTRDHGYWKLAPDEEIVSIQRRYRERTLILETTFETADGEVCVVDFMPPRERHSRVIRLVKGVRGSVAMKMNLAIRFDYGRTIPWVTNTQGVLRAIAGPDMVQLHCGLPLRGEGMETVSEFVVHEGDSFRFVLSYGSSLEDPPSAIVPEEALDTTQATWGAWNEKQRYEGPYQKAVERSLMTLKAMAYEPSGGMVAAVTTSLPEQIGGPRNWDYRYCWLRDTAFTLLVLMRAGYVDEAIAWRRWLLRAIAGAPDQIQTIYGIYGERQLVEWEAGWLPGYERSQPVRIGNAASGQFQLDVFGEVASALLRTPEASDEISISATPLQAKLIDHLCRIWDQPDNGIWEIRGDPKHFTHSKVMAWVALDRAIRHYEQHDGAGDIERWRKNRDPDSCRVCERGFNKEMNSFVQSYDSTELDASCLRIPLVGFLPPEDPRVVGTIEAIKRDLMQDGFVLRYNTERTDDGVNTGEGAFLACSFWMVTSLWLIGQRDEATAMFERLLALQNDVGLLAEEYDPVNKRMLGNFPQALSHISLLHAAFAISGLWKPGA